MEDINSVDRMSLIQKLAKIRDIASVAKRDKQGFGYTYTDITEILAKVTAGMRRYGVSLIPEIVPNTAKVIQNTIVDTKVDKTGKAYEKKSTESVVTADMRFTWVNNDNTNDCIQVPWFVTGSQSDPSQAFGSGLTYTMRQFLTSYFQIAQAETDVDTYRSKQKAAEASEDIMIAEEIINQFDTLLKTYLADHSEQADEVKKFITRFEKKANYFAIKEPSLAAKLLDDFKKTYLNEGEK